MGETHFTPGPWYVIGEPDWREHGIDDFMICAHVGPEPHEKDLFITNIGPVMAPVQTEEEVGATNLANANLIAAAPLLYAALAEIVAGWEGFAVHDEGAARARAALAAARGER